MNFKILKILTSLFLVIAIFSSSKSFAGNRIDSISSVLKYKTGADRISSLNDLASELMFSNVNKSLSLYSEALDISYKYKIDSNIAISSCNLGVAYLIMYKNDSALKYLYFSKDLFQKLNDSLRYANSCRTIADVYMNYYNLDSAQKNYIVADEIFEKIMQKKVVKPLAQKLYSMLLNNLGLFYLDIKDFTKAKEFLFKAIQYYYAMGKNSNIAVAYHDISCAYYKTNNFDSARYYSQKAIASAKQASNQVVLGAAYQVVGSILVSKGEYKKALDTLNLALEIDKKFGEQEGIAEVYAKIGEVYKNLSNYKKSAEYYQQALALADTINANELKVDCFRDLSDIYSKMGNYKQAFQYFKLYHNLSDSLSNSDKVEKIAKLDKQYNFEKQQRQNENLAQENKLKTVELSFIIIALIIIIIITVVALILINKSRVSQKKLNSLLLEKNEQIFDQNEKLVELNATKDKFFSIVAHDIRNPLNAINLGIEFLNLEFERMTQSEKKSILEELHLSSINLTKLFENLLEWSRSQRGVISFVPTEIDMRLLANNTIALLGAQAEKKGIHLINEIAENTICIGDMNMIDTIIRNLCSNSIKFTNSGGFVKIASEPLINKTRIIISDNGIGMEQSIIDKLFKIGEGVSSVGTAQERGTGLGLILCKEFIDRHDSEIKVESKHNQGSTFSFELKTA